jgi:hypothetical protein
MKMATWQSDLLARHPDLFTVVENGKTYASGYPFVGDGWRDLVEKAVGRIADVLAAAPSARVTLVEIKAKYATLRMYWDGANLTKAAEDSIAEAVALAEARSACSCETCGAAGVLHRAGRQLLIACAKHAMGGAPVPIIEPGWENIHLVRGTRDGKASILVCQRYLRDTDCFVDVDPQSIGIEEE